ncbi:MAG: NmrA family NAD(P)-binding protein [Chitinophagaceae bacterium]
MKVVVTGSLGHISRPLAKELIKKGHEVLIVTSSEQRKPEIEALGGKSAIGSVEDVDFLTATFSGADVVYAMIPPDFSVPDIVARYTKIGNCYAKAILDSGVRKVVQLSSWGAHLPSGTGVIVGSYHVEQILNKLDNVSITYLRPTSFYYNLFHYMDMIKIAGFIGTNFGGDDKVSMVAPADIAAAAVEEIEAADTGNRVRYVASDEHTCSEIAAILGAAIGKPDLKWMRFTDEQTQAAMEKNHVPANVAALLVEINAAIHSGLLAEDYNLNKPVLGRVKLGEFAKEFAAVFSAKSQQHDHL